LKNYDEDIIVKLENQIENKSLIQILKIKKGVISSKKEYKFNYCDKDLIEEFLKIYYSQNSVPKEILLEKEIFDNVNNKKIIEKYLSKIKKGKVTIKIPKKGEKLGLIKLSILNAKQNFNKNDILIELKNKLSLPSIPKTIECFDMSNLGSDYLVGAMVQFKNSKPNKQAYRKYQIKSFSGKNDDFAAMQEVIYRRYLRLKNENKKMPDLILIDGGKGQLRSGIQALKNLNIKIPIVSLAKRDEEIYVLGRKDPYKFDSASKMMLFLRNIRDSTHNYVISYNRKKREMRMKEEFKKN